MVICGKWLSHIRADWRFANLVDVELVAGLGRDEFLARRRKGYDIYYLHGQVQRLRFGRGYDIREYGAGSLIPDAKS